MKLKRGEDAGSEVTLQSQEADPLEIKAVETTPSFLKAEVLPAGGDPHVRKLRLKVGKADGGSKKR